MPVTVWFFFALRSSLMLSDMVEIVMLPLLHALLFVFSFQILRGEVYLLRF